MWWRGAENSYDLASNQIGIVKMLFLLGKLALFMIYPVGIFATLVVLGLLRRIFASKGSGMSFFALALIVITLASSPLAARWMVSNLENQYPPVPMESLEGADIAIVLSGGLAEPISPRVQIELVGASDRYLHAARLYRQSKIKRVYISGGNVFEGFSDLAESRYAKSLLMEWGVPGDKIGIGENSRTTRENAIETRNYLSEKGWITKPVFLVTSAIHMPRAVETFLSEGIKVIPASTDILMTEPTVPLVFKWLPSAAALQLNTVAWHEMIGLWVYRMRGWASKA